MTKMQAFILATRRFEAIDAGDLFALEISLETYDSDGVLVMAEFFASFFDHNEMPQKLLLKIEDHKHAFEAIHAKTSIAGC